MSESTPNGTRVVAHRSDGSEVDITEAVQVMYDLVTGSMDWGSGFLTEEDALPVVHVAKTCGFTDYEEAERYVEALHTSEEQRRLSQKRLQERAEARQKELDWLANHEHVFGATGKCVWPQCYMQNEQPVGHAFKLHTKGSTEPMREVEWTMLPEGDRVVVLADGPVNLDVVKALEAKIRAR